MWGGCMCLHWCVSLPEEDFCVFLCIFLAFKCCLFPSRFPQKSSCLVWLFPLSVLKQMSKMKWGRFFFRFIFRGGEAVDDDKSLFPERPIKKGPKLFHSSVLSQLGETGSGKERVVGVGGGRGANLLLSGLGCFAARPAAFFNRREL